VYIGNGSFPAGEIAAAMPEGIAAPNAANACARRPAAAGRCGT
jgi:hypothetical protein